MRPWSRLLLIVLLTMGSALAFWGAGSSKHDGIAAAQLPTEARQTLALIKQGGPFPYPRDGIVFNNFEKRLPPQARGYYREYTVKTPGRRDRGPRRIVAGKAAEYYYTEDHYASFRRIRE
ncbi:ribonuclease domain-containing protein [Azonexus sp.]|uniref:ribonuclease domain-containing protein n=1 Tax=Azonexus sp. TaxID=1872668 RepID=UPI0039E666ED